MKFLKVTAISLGAFVGGFIFLDWAVGVYGDVIKKRER